MVKAKDIISIKDNIMEYKAALDKETEFIEKLKIESKIREQQYRLMDVQSQLFNIEICLHKNAKLHKEIFIDKYINLFKTASQILIYWCSRINDSCLIKSR